MPPSLHFKPEGNCTIFLRHAVTHPQGIIATNGTEPESASLSNVLRVFFFSVIPPV